MSYISAWRMGNDVLVWERTEQGRITKQYKGIFEFYSQRHDGEYTSIFDEKLIKHEFTNWNDFKDMRNMFTQGHVPLYESDIGPEMKILSKHYYNVPTPKLHFTMWDIEVDYDPEKGFSSVENPYAPINAVALFHHWKNESVVIAVPPAGWDWNNKLEDLARETNTNIILVKSERDLLIKIIEQIQDTDVLSGWNSDFFDTPYLAKRVEKVLGKQWFQFLSFPDCHPPRYRTVELFGQERVVCDLGGRISWDYMELFKKFEMNERPSYSLEAISNEILPELPKLSYTGSLHQLYNNDFEHFVRYNIRDTEVLGGFERVLGYLSLANELYHSACGQPNNILGTIKLTDLSITNYCHYVLDKKVPDCNPFAESTGIHGAMVLVPKRGLHDLLGSIDITSLYPSAIRSVNISPDTLVGQCEGVLTKDDRAKHSAWEAIYRGDPNEEVTVVYEPRSGMTGTETHTGLEWRSILKQRKWAVSGYGTFFSQEKQGIIPAVLTDWFGQRNHYKKLMTIAKNQAKELRQLETRTPEQEREMVECDEKASFYDRLQYVYKIKLNATYGATTNAHFRFFDLRLGQSTTGSGRAILQHMGSQVALLLDGKYDIHSDSIIYGDTDSCYFKTNAETFHDLNREQQYDMAIKIADQIGKEVDNSFDTFCEQAFCIQPEFSGIVRCEREVVAKRGIFVTKKRYVLKLIDLDGYRVDKLKAMGLEMKKTTTPKIIRSFLEDVVNMILDGEKEWSEIDDFIVDYRKKVRTEYPLVEIGLPKGVKNVEYYTGVYRVEGEKARLPGHVAASIHFNECLKRFGDKENSPIASGSKIKVFYLTKKYGKFKSIAFPTDLEQTPKWFDDNFECDRLKHESRLIDNNLSIIFDAIDRVVPTAQTQFNDVILEW